MADESNGFAKSSIALFFAAGGLMGAGLGILFAPAEGRQIRGRVKEFTEEVKGKTVRLSKDWKEKAARFLEKRKEVQEANGEGLPVDIEGVKSESAAEKEPLSVPGAA